MSPFGIAKHQLSGELNSLHDKDGQLRWRLGVFAAITITLLALYPQIALILERGDTWNGSYTSFSQDEIAYSAYVNALIEGRPRRNDPYTGRDDASGAEQPESLFSIQFIPAYLIALPARALGISASSSFIGLTAIVAFVSTLAIFWLIGVVTGDERLAATSALVVLCLGTFALLYAPLRSVFGLDTSRSYEYFPFLRRYVPAVPFPLFFIFCGLVWRALVGQRKRKIWIDLSLAGVVFGILVFSYFYLWTAAAAWFGCLALLWLIARPQDYQQSLKRFGVMAFVGFAALIPYFLLLSRRAPTMDTVQLLALTHAPDLSRSSIKLGLIICASIGLARWRGYLDWRDPVVLLATSFALTPLVVFNQQVVTGRSLQPLHYELYITKYLALMALILTIALLFRRRRVTGRRSIRAEVLICISLIAVGWGVIETVLETRKREWASRTRDEEIVVPLRLAELGRDPATGVLDRRGVALYTNLDQADISPVFAPQPVLWSPHVPAFSGVTLEENRERIYQYLYYSGEDMRIDEQGFDALPYRKKYLIRSTIEWGHNDPAWTVNWNPITAADIRTALQKYASYASSFTRERASKPTLAYVVAETEAARDLSNLDRWYERDSGERIGKFTLYRVTLRP